MNIKKEIQHLKHFIMTIINIQQVYFWHFDKPKALIKTFKIFIIFFTYFILILSLYAQDYVIGPDDVLKITVYREDELNRKVRVTSDGYISFPLIGKIKAKGESVTELKFSLEKKLKKYLKKPHVTIFIEEYSSITVSGHVKMPGSYPLKRGLSVLDAISLAGGFTKIASRNDVKVLRVENGTENIIKVKVADIGKGDKDAKDIQLKRGDIIIVSESFF